MTIKRKLKNTHHPIQPLGIAEDGVLRFKCNAIVREAGREGAAAMTETIDAMLLEFADRFHLDGDLLRCTSCNRGIVASRQDEDFVHAPSCNLRMVKGRPWSTLQAILAGPLVDAMNTAIAERDALKTKLAALVEAIEGLDPWPHSDEGPVCHSYWDKPCNCLAQPNRDAIAAALAAAKEQP